MSNSIEHIPNTNRLESIDIVRGLIMIIMALDHVRCILLANAEKISARLKKMLINYGRVPFFFFIVHLAIISLTSYLWTYFSFGKGVNLSFESAKDWPAEYHPSLLRTYFVWFLVIAALYFPCLWFARYKAKNKAWWLSYL